MTKSAYLESLLEQNRREDVLDRAFDWDVLDIVLGEKSVIDIPKVQTETLDEAHIFLKSLGYNLDVPAHTNMVEKIRKEAVAFIERRLVRDPDGIDPPLKVPTQVRMEKDVRKLLVWASGPLDDELQHWACSVLRVMYTITHVQNDLALNFFPQIQKQILDRVLRFVYTDSSGAVHLGQDSNGIRLYMMDIKSQKSGESMILKLLHKVENEGSDIFDRVGFRFVTYSKVECLLALQYLQANHIFAYPNVKVARSRNTLVNHAVFRAMIDAPFRRWVNKEIGTEDLIAIAEDIAGSPACMPRRDPKQMSYNVYSSTEYSSIQITARQLIHVKGPAVLTADNGDIEPAVKDYCFYFPMEIQLLDKDSYIESRRGRASHEEYKRKQLLSSRQRVFPWLSTTKLRAEFRS